MIKTILSIICLLVYSDYTSAQTYFEHLKRNAPTYGLVFVSGMGNGLMDATSSTALYEQTRLPAWTPGAYMGPKDKTWVNKWKQGESGKERFFGSSTVFVATTDVWHGAQFVSNTAWQVGTLTYKQPDKTLYKTLDFVLLKVLYGAGWHAMNKIIEK